MTGREKIEALIKKCEDDAEAGFAIAEGVVAEANSQLTIAQSLRELLAVASDWQCEKVTHDWKEQKAS